MYEYYLTRIRFQKISGKGDYIKSLADPAVKAHVRRLLSPAQPSNNQESNMESSKDVLEDKDNVDCGKSAVIPEVSSTYSPTPTSTIATTKSNGSCSDASVSSELEALLPSAVDHFNEGKRSQWEPLFAEKFAHQKNTPRYSLVFNTLENTNFLI